MPDNLGRFEFVGGDSNYLEHGGVFAARSADGVVLLDIPARLRGDDLTVFTKQVLDSHVTAQNDKYVEQSLGMLSVPRCPLQRAYCYAEYGLHELLEHDWLDEQDNASVDAALAWEGPWGFLERVAREAEYYL